MNVFETILQRLRKMIRVTYNRSVAGVGADAKLTIALGGKDQIFIDSDFRHRLDEWFKDLVEPFPKGAWKEATLLKEIAKQIFAKMKSEGTVSDYNAHVSDLLNEAFEKAAGAGAQSVPVAERHTVRDSLNDALLRWLLTNVALDDLVGDRAAIFGRIKDRMLII
jgi:hypothetical protein